MYMSMGSNFRPPPFWQEMVVSFEKNDNLPRQGLSQSAQKWARGFMGFHRPGGQAQQKFAQEAKRATEEISGI
jgi:hypothetical protein